MILQEKKKTPKIQIITLLAKYDNPGSFPWRVGATPLRAGCPHTGHNPFSRKIEAAGREREVQNKLGSLRRDPPETSGYPGLGMATGKTQGWSTSSQYLFLKQTGLSGSPEAGGVLTCMKTPQKTSLLQRRDLYLGPLST